MNKYCLSFEINCFILYIIVIKDRWLLYTDNTYTVWAVVTCISVVHKGKGQNANYSTFYTNNKLNYKLKNSIALFPDVIKSALQNLI